MQQFPWIYPKMYTLLCGSWSDFNASFGKFNTKLGSKFLDPVKQYFARSHLILILSSIMKASLISEAAFVAAYIYMIKPSNSKALPSPLSSYILHELYLHSKEMLPRALDFNHQNTHEIYAKL